MLYPFGKRLYIHSSCEIWSCVFSPAFFFVNILGGFPVYHLFILSYNFFWPHSSLSSNLEIRNLYDSAKLLSFSLHISVTTCLLLPLWNLVHWLCREKQMGLAIWDIPKRKVGLSFQDGGVYSSVCVWLLVNFRASPLFLLEVRFTDRLRPLVFVTYQRVLFVGAGQAMHVFFAHRVVFPISPGSYWHFLFVAIYDIYAIWKLPYFT